jgi:hypothetical protein
MIFIIHPLLRIPACLTSVTHLTNGNRGANTKLLKIDALIETGISTFRKFSNFRKRAEWLVEEPNPKGDMWRNP